MTITLDGVHVLHYKIFCSNLLLNLSTSTSVIIKPYENIKKKNLFLSTVYIKDRWSMESHLANYNTFYNVTMS